MAMIKAEQERQAANQARLRSKPTPCQISAGPLMSTWTTSSRPYHNMLSIAQICYSPLINNLLASLWECTMCLSYGTSYRMAVNQMRNGDISVKKIPKLEMAPIDITHYKEMIGYFKKVFQRLQIIEESEEKQINDIPTFGYVSFERFAFDFIALLGEENLSIDFQHICAVVKLITRTVLFEEKLTGRIQFVHIDDIKLPKRLQPIISAFLKKGFSNTFTTYDLVTLEKRFKDEFKQQEGEQRVFLFMNKTKKGDSIVKTLRHTEVKRYLSLKFDLKSINTHRVKTTSLSPDTRIVHKQKTQPLMIIQIQNKQQDTDHVNINVLETFNPDDSFLESNLSRRGFSTLERTTPGPSASLTIEQSRNNIHLNEVSQSYDVQKPSEYLNEKLGENDAIQYLKKFIFARVAQELRKEQQQRPQNVQKDYKGQVIISKEVDMTDEGPQALESKFNPQIKPAMTSLDLTPLLSAQSRLRHGKTLRKDQQVPETSNSPHRLGSLHHLSSFQSDQTNDRADSTANIKLLATNDSGTTEIQKSPNACRIYTQVSPSIEVREYTTEPELTPKTQVFLQSLNVDSITDRMHSIITNWPLPSKTSRQAKAAVVLPDNRYMKSLDKKMENCNKKVVRMNETSMMMSCMREKDFLRALGSKGDLRSSKKVDSDSESQDNTTANRRHQSTGISDIHKFDIKLEDTRTQECATANSQVNTFSDKSKSIAPPFSRQNYDSTSACIAEMLVDYTVVNQDQQIQHFDLPSRSMSITPEVITGTGDASFRQNRNSLNKAKARAQKQLWRRNSYQENDTSTMAQNSQRSSDTGPLPQPLVNFKTLEQRESIASRLKEGMQRQSSCATGRSTGEQALQTETDVVEEAAEIELPSITPTSMQRELGGAIQIWSQVTVGARSFSQAGQQMVPARRREQILRLANTNAVNSHKIQMQRARARNLSQLGEMHQKAIMPVNLKTPLKCLGTSKPVYKSPHFGQGETPRPNMTRGEPSPGPWTPCYGNESHTASSMKTYFACKGNSGIEMIQVDEQAAVQNVPIFSKEAISKLPNEARGSALGRIRARPATDMTDRQDLGTMKSPSSAHLQHGQELQNIPLQKIDINLFQEIEEASISKKDIESGRETSQSEQSNNNRKDTMVYVSMDEKGMAKFQKEKQNTTPIIIQGQKQQKSAMGMYTANMPLVDIPDVQGQSQQFIEDSGNLKRAVTYAEGNHSSHKNRKQIDLNFLARPEVRKIFNNSKHVNQNSNDRGIRYSTAGDRTSTVRTPALTNMSKEGNHSSLLQPTSPSVERVKRGPMNSDLPVMSRQGKRQEEHEELVYGSQVLHPGGPLFDDSLESSVHQLPAAINIYRTNPSTPGQQGYPEHQFSAVAKMRPRVRVQVHSPGLFAANAATAKDGPPMNKGEDLRHLQEQETRHLFSQPNSSSAPEESVCFDTLQSISAHQQNRQKTPVKLLDQQQQHTVSPVAGDTIPQKRKRPQISRLMFGSAQQGTRITPTPPILESTDQLTNHDYLSALKDLQDGHGQFPPKLKNRLLPEAIKYYENLVQQQVASLPEDMQFQVPKLLPPPSQISHRASTSPVQPRQPMGRNNATGFKNRTLCAATKRQAHIQQSNRDKGKLHLPTFTKKNQYSGQNHFDRIFKTNVEVQKAANPMAVPFLCKKLIKK